MPLDYPSKPRSEVGNRVMTPTHQGGFNGLKLLTHPFFDSSSFDSEPLIPVALATNMHKPQELKGLWLTLSSLLPALGRKATELHQPSLAWVQGEAKGAEPFSQLVQKMRRLLLVLKPQHDIIGKARDDDIARCPLLAPGMTPEVKDVMQVEIRHEWANHQPLGDPACRLRLLTAVDDIDLKPLIDQT